MPVKAPLAFLAEDRFGNAKSALYLQGTAESYLNLGTSPLFKIDKITISLWVNLARRVYAGRGYECNPVFCMKNSARSDFYNAYSIAYDAYCDRLGASSTLDSSLEAGVLAKDPIQFGNWYHIVLSSDRDSLAFYLDGELQGRVKKGFHTTFLLSDSAMVGHSANKKNLRFSLGAFDDIMIFNRVLSEQEVRELYEAPNPNRYRIILGVIIKCILIAAAIVLVAFLLVYNRRKSLKLEKERFEMKSKMSEMEISIIKAQINPHFMSNCLSAVQNLIVLRKLEEANQYIARFAFIVRQVLNYSTQTLVSLGEELEIMRLNVDLEQLRFENAFVFNLQVAEDIDAAAILVPPLIFQPIIENAIWHGLLPLKEQRSASILVSIKKENGLLMTTIEDNGVGRQPNKLGIGNTRSKGLKITTQRVEHLKNLYNSPATGVYLSDLLDEHQRPAGTRVTILLPLNLTHEAHG